MADKRGKNSEGEWFTSFSSVLPTFQVGYHAGKPLETVVYCFYKITLSFYEFTGTINHRFLTNQNAQTIYSRLPQNSLRFVGLVDSVIFFWTSSPKRFLCVTRRLRSDVSPHVRVWNPESWVLECGILLKESGIPLTIGIQDPSSTDKYWNPVTGIRNPRREIQNPRLSWIPLHGVRRTEQWRIQTFR